MKNSSRLTRCLALVAGLLSIVVLALPATAAPKKVLVVTTTAGFRHSSIPTAEKVLAEMAKRTDLFTVEYARVEPNDPQFKGPDGKTDAGKVQAAVKLVLAEKLSAEALKQYDGIIFANTSGDLPLPDRPAFLEFIRSGKGFIGMHAASDTLRGWPEYLEMLGGEFRNHGAQVGVEAINQDKTCPACQHLEATWKVYDEIYQFQKFDASKVHGLLTLDKHPNEKTPGNYQIAWCKGYGKGRVFYTALGHREDVWDPNTPAGFRRLNPAEVARAYQEHILGGIKWALGLTAWEPGKGKLE